MVPRGPAWPLNPVASPQLSPGPAGVLVEAHSDHLLLSFAQAPSSMPS